MPKKLEIILFMCNVLLLKHNKYANINTEYQKIASFDTIEEAKEYISKQNKEDKQWEYHYCCQWKE